MTPEEKVWTQYNYLVSHGYTAEDAAQILVDTFRQEKDATDAALRMAYTIKNLARQSNG